MAVPVSVPPGLSLRFQLWHDLIQKYDEISGLTVGDDNGEVMIYAFVETHTGRDLERLILASMWHSVHRPTPSAQQQCGISDTKANLSQRERQRMKIVKILSHNYDFMIIINIRCININYVISITWFLNHPHTIKPDDIRCFIKTIISLTRLALLSSGHT